MKSGNKTQVMEDSSTASQLEHSSKLLGIVCSLSAVFFHMTSHITEAGVNLDACGSNWRFAVWVVICFMGAVSLLLDKIREHC